MFIFLEEWFLKLGYFYQRSTSIGDGQYVLRKYEIIKRVFDLLFLGTVPAKFSAWEAEVVFGDAEEYFTIDNPDWELHPCLKDWRVLLSGDGVFPAPSFEVTLTCGDMDFSFGCTMDTDSIYTCLFAFNCPVFHVQGVSGTQAAGVVKITPQFSLSSFADLVPQSLPFDKNTFRAKALKKKRHVWDLEVYTTILQKYFKLHFPFIFKF